MATPITTVTGNALDGRPVNRHVYGKLPIHERGWPVYEVTIMYYQMYITNGEWRWRLRAANHQIIASGEGYQNESDCLHAIGLVKGSSNAPVYKQ